LSRPTQVFLLSLALMISVLIAWGMRFINEDLFVALCAGRDVVAGRLAEPDTWSYTTAGEVWVNQGWLSHLFLYLTYSLLGNFGAVLTKGILFLVCLGILFFRCRRMGIAPEVAIFALTIGTLAIAPYLQIRAENFGLVCFLLMTTLLTWRTTSVWTSCIGALAVLWLWSNVHGSFVLAFPLIGLKLLVQTFTTSGEISRRTRAILPWFATLLAGLAVAAFGNPFGPANLLMPFRQLSARSITDRSADWLPLLDWSSLWETSRFHPLDAGPFILAVLGLISLVIAHVVIVRVRSKNTAFVSETLKHPRVDVLMEALIPLMMIPPSFLFRRILLFAGISMIPLLALLIQSVLRGSTRGDVRAGKARPSNHKRYLLSVATVAWVAGIGWIFYATTVVPFLPWNPMIRSRPLIQQLTSFDFYPARVISFMKSNHISGRLFTSWVISDVLLFHVPDVKVFMDCRDQSAYSDSVIKTFFSIVNTKGDNPKSVAETMKLLDSYKVSAIVLETSPRDLGLAVTLMKTREWGCIFYDDDAIILFRADDPEYGPTISAGRLPEFTYPDAETRSVTEGMLSFFMTGAISQSERSTLESIVKDRQDPNVYGLLFLAGIDRSGCLNAPTKSYMLAELGSLVRIHQARANRTADMLECVVRIASLLEADIKKCAPTVETTVLKSLIESTNKELKRMRRRYVGLNRP
jgi:hypothetical protein